MAGKTVISDYLLALGFDGRQVHKGLDGVNKHLNAVGKKQIKTQKDLTKAIGVTNAAYKEGYSTVNKTAQKQRQILAMAKKRDKLESRTARSQARTARSGDPYKLVRKRARTRAIQKELINRHSKAPNLQQRLLAYKSDKSNKASSATRLKIQSDKAAAKAALARAKADRKAVNSVRRFANSLKTNTQSNFLRNLALVSGGLYTLSRVLSGVTDAAKQQMEAERALVGIEGVGEALTFGADGKSTGIVAGSGGLTTSEFYKENKEFLKDLVDTFAVELPAAADTFRSVLGASIQQLKDPKSGITSESLKELMIGVSAGAAAFKMGSEDQKLMWLGITQIMQKGKVQAEELTRQIGQRNPLAIQAMLKAMQKVYKQADMTHETMYKMMREGKILAKDVMPEWGRQMKNLADNMTEGDYIKYMEKSLGGAVQTFRSRMSLAWNDVFTEDAFKPMASVMSTFRKMAEQSRFITDQGGAYLGNIANEVNKRLTPVLDKMKFLNAEYRKNILTNKSASDAREVQIAQQVSNAFKMAEDFGKGFMEGINDVWSALKKFFYWVSPMIAETAKALGFDSTGKSFAEIAGYVAAMVLSFKTLNNLPIIGNLTNLLKSLAGGGISTLLGKGGVRMGAAGSGAGGLMARGAGAAGAAILANPIVAGIVALLAAVVAAYFLSDDFKRVVDSVAERLMTSFENLKGRLVQLFTDIFDESLGGIWGAYKRAVTPDFLESSNKKDAWDYGVWEGLNNMFTNPFKDNYNKGDAITAAKGNQQLGSLAGGFGDLMQLPTQKVEVSVGVTEDGGLKAFVGNEIEQHEADQNDTGIGER